MPWAGRGGARTRARRLSTPRRTAAAAPRARPPGRTAAAARRLALCRHDRGRRLGSRRHRVGIGVTGHPLTGHVRRGAPAGRAGLQCHLCRLTELAEGVVHVLWDGAVGAHVPIRVEQVDPPAVGGADLVGRGVRPDSQHRVGVHGLFPSLGSCVQVQRNYPRKVTPTGHPKPPTPWPRPQSTAGRACPGRDVVRRFAGFGPIHPRLRGWRCPRHDLRTGGTACSHRLIGSHGRSPSRRWRCRPGPRPGAPPCSGRSEPVLRRRCGRSTSGRTSRPGPSSGRSCGRLVRSA